MKTPLLLSALSACACLATALSLTAQDWPQWRGPARDGKVSGFTAPEKWPTALTQKWKATVGTGDATPALVGDKLYVFSRQGENEVVACLSATDGKELWSNKYQAQAVSGAAARHPGPRSSPVVAEGKVITLGVGGVLSCLDAATGKELWRKDEFPKVVPQFFVGMSPIVVDGMCVAHLGGKGTGAVIAFDLATGNTKWKWEGDGPAYDSPVLLTCEGSRQLVLVTEKNLVALGVADGKLLWQVPATAQGRFYNSATPIVDGQTIILTGQGRGIKALKIEKQGADFSAKELWSNEEVGTGFSTPVLKDGLLFGLSDKGSLFCVNAKDGKTMWVDSATRRENFGAVLDAGSVILALPSNGELIALKPGGNQYAEVGRVKVSEAATYAHPVLAGKRIIVKDAEAVTMYTLD